MKNFILKNIWPLALSLLALIIRLPLLFRLGWADFPEFYRDFYMASGIVNGRIPLLGPPSMQSHFNFGPLYYYLLSPLLLLYQHPAMLILAGILLYAVSTFIFYRLIKLWINDEFTARLGTLFYAISIYGVHLTSYTSNPNFLPLFVLLYFYCLTLIVQNARPRWPMFFWLGLVYGAAAQLHTTAALILPLASVWPIGKYIVGHRQNMAELLKQLGFAIVGAVIVTLPYIWFELTHRFQNLLSLLNFGHQHLSGQNSAFNFQAIVRFFSGSLNPLSLQIDYAYLQPNWLYWIVAVAAIICLIIFLRQVYKHRKTSAALPISNAGFAMVVGWFIAGCTISLAFDRALHDHYLIILWPIPVIGFAWLSGWLHRRWNFGYPIVALVVLVSALQLFSLYNQPRPAWQQFFLTYPRYQNNPNTPNIGFSTVQP